MKTISTMMRMQLTEVDASRGHTEGYVLPTWAGAEPT